MSTKKYVIVKSESIVHKGRTLYRIKALKTFCVACTAMSIVVKKGELGGFVESENNLSQEGTCWIYNGAKVYGDAKVLDDAFVYNTAEVFENAKIYGNACIFDNAKIYGNAKIFDDARVCDNARIFGFAKIFNKAIVYGNAKVYGNTQIFGKAKVYGNAEVYENAAIFDYAFIFGDAKVFSNAKIFGTTWLYGAAKIDDKLNLNKGKYIFKSLNVDETLSEIEPICYKISFAVRVIELKLPIEQGYIESLVSQFAEYNELADSFRERTYLSPKEKEILAMLSQCKKDVKILKKVK